MARGTGVRPGPDGGGARLSRPPADASDAACTTEPGRVSFDARRAIGHDRTVTATVVAARPVVGARPSMCRSGDVLGATGYEDNHRA